MTLLDGRPLAAEIREQAAEAAAAGRRRPCSRRVVATDDPATAWYLGSIAKAAAAAGIGLLEERVPDGDGAGVLERLGALSGDAEVDGIICLTPLPDGLTLAEAGRADRPGKDVDGANPASLGRLAAGLPAFAPATAQAVLELLHCAGTRRSRAPRRSSSAARRSSGSRSRCSSSPSTRR